jgi:hypothetical protein
VLDSADVVASVCLGEAVSVPGSAPSRSCPKLVILSGLFALVTCCFGAPRGNRTPNPLIKSQLLCQLS